jgi:hypothetical protein
MSELQQDNGAPVASVAFGLDTVVANILPIDAQGKVQKCVLPDELQEELNAYKLQAQEEEEKIPTRWAFPGGNLFMLDKAGAPYKWILEHPKIKVSIGRGVRAPLWGEVRFSSEYLWEHRKDYSRAFSDVWLFLNTIFGEHIFLQAAGVDIAKDFTGWEVGSIGLDALRERFITRAASDDALPGGFNEDGMIDGPDHIRRRWRRVTGLPFGKRNAAVSAILYDKTHEIRYQSPEKAWMYEVWPVERDKETGRPMRPVWRLEARFKRKAIHEGGIESLWELLDRLPEMWSYVLGHIGGGADGLPDGWLRYVVPSEDTNRARWLVAPEWEVLQDSSGLGESLLDVPLGPFIRQRKREVNLDRAVSSVAGYASTFEVFRRDLYRQLGKVFDAEPDISETFHALFEEVQSYLDEKSSRQKHADFASVVAKKSVLYHVTEKHETSEE